LSITHLADTAAPTNGAAPVIEDPHETSTDLVAAAQSAGAIIQAESPEEIIAKAGRIATALKGLIDDRGLAVDVGGRKPHVEVGAWQALGTMVGAFGGQPLHAETIWSRVALDPKTGEPIHRQYSVKETRYRKKSEGGGVAKILEYDVEGFDWEACVDIRTPGGVVVGRAEAMCSRTEAQWAIKHDPAVRSMAETRAESRAFRRAVGWIVNIAGYNPTPAEEMPPDAGAPEPASDATNAQMCTALMDLARGDRAKAQAAYGQIRSVLGGQLTEAAGQAVLLAARLTANGNGDPSRQGRAQATAAQPPAPAASCEQFVARVAVAFPSPPTEHGQEVDMADALAKFLGYAGTTQLTSDAIATADEVLAAARHSNIPADETLAALRSIAERRNAEDQTQRITLAQRPAAAIAELSQWLPF
jgi:hypothetical protein